MSTKEEVLKFYQNLQTHYANYHNHKELSAWAGLVLYVLFCGLIIKASVPSNHEFITAVLLLFAVVCVTATVFLYIKNQLEMKDIGGATSAAALYLQTEILQSESKEFSQYLIVEESGDMKAQSSHVLPLVLLKKRDAINCKGRAFQDLTKMAIYSLIGISAFAVILLKWVALLS